MTRADLPRHIAALRSGSRMDRAPRIPLQTPLAVLVANAAAVETLRLALALGGERRHG